MNKVLFATLLVALTAVEALCAVEQDGGEVIKPGPMKGSIQIGNAQKTVNTESLEEIRGMLWKRLGFKINLDTVNPVTLDNVNSALKKSGAAAGIYLVEDKTLPVLLVSPEEHWSIVNVSRLAEGAPTPKYTEMRVKKELVRAFVYTCGGADATRGHQMMNAIRKVDDLDAIAMVDLPLDILMRFNGYMRKLGVTSARRMSYEEACMEGWAPQPTNEVQKTIWKRVHEPPKNPMKIEFDPKKGR